MTYYKIRAAVEGDGTPMWALVRTIVNPFASGSKTIAVNRDKSVLERAIQHLKPFGDGNGSPQR